MIKKLYLVLFFLFSISSIYAQAGFLTSGVIIGTNNINLYYNTLNPNFILYPSAGVIPPNPLKYNYFGSSRNWLDANSCNLVYNSGTNTISANWAADSLATPFSSYINYLKNTAPQPLGNNILNANLWMKSLVQYKITNSSGSPAKIFIGSSGGNTNIKNGVILNITDSGNKLPATPDFTSKIQDYANLKHMPYSVFLDRWFWLFIYVAWAFQSSKLSTGLWCYYNKSLKLIAAHEFCK